MKQILVLLITALLMCVSPAFAQDVSFTASVSSTTVAIGEAFSLELKINGDVNIDQMNLPPLDGFDIRYLGPSRQVSVINGRTSKSVAFRYTVFPLKAGQFTIPSLQLEVEGQPYQTQPIQITVGASGQAGGQQANAAQTLDDKIFMQVDVSRQEYYMGEKIPLTIKLFVADLAVQDVQFPEIEPIGFTLGEFSQPTQYTQIINGVEYRVVDFDAHLFPTRSGSIEIGPVNLGANILYKESGRDRSDIFGDSFFSGIFSSYRKRPITLNAPAISINVASLPEENKPDGFSGAVGRFDFKATVGPDEVNVGDPLTLRMTLAGEGNLKSVEFPVLNDERFRVYDPQIKEENGQKFLEQVIIPKEEEITEVSPIDFHYFDVNANAYKTITQGPFPITVNPAVDGQNFKMVGFERQIPTLMTKQEKFGRDIIFIKDAMGSLRSHARPFLGSWGFYLLMMVYVLSWGGLLMFHIYREKLKNDPSYARRVGAFREAEKALSLVKDRSAHVDVVQGYQALYHLLRNYVVDKQALPRGELGVKDILTYAENRNVTQETLGQLKAVLDRAEQARFAGSSMSASMQEDVDAVGVVLKEMEASS